jgi:hypothetical protein
MQPTRHPVQHIQQLQHYNRYNVFNACLSRVSRHCPRSCYNPPSVTVPLNGEIEVSLTTDNPTPTTTTPRSYYS